MDVDNAKEQKPILLKAKNHNQSPKVDQIKALLIVIHHAIWRVVPWSESSLFFQCHLDR